MPGRRFSAREDRQAQHIAASERARGVSPARAKSIGYATLNAQKSRAKRQQKKKR